jgi:hypothetical protein
MEEMTGFAEVRFHKIWTDVEKDLQNKTREISN